jgi:dTDP-4-dehydrorhamnose reductase
MHNKNVLVIGAGGIIGQHMMISQPENIDCNYTRRSFDSSGKWIQFDVNKNNISKLLDTLRPDVIVNLAGENTVDKVESDPNKYYDSNVTLPIKICKWAVKNNCNVIQVSTQGIFSGDNPPYTPLSTPDPITFYGRQKALAETLALNYTNIKIVRSTFVLGVRPLQEIGRKNPLEMIFETKNQKQVEDRYFSPVFAFDVADTLWDLCINFENYEQKIIHLGNPITCSRFSIAKDVQSFVDEDIVVESASYLDFPSHIKRPADTSWLNGECIYKTEYLEGLKKSYLEWKKIKK